VAQNEHNDKGAEMNEKELKRLFCKFIIEFIHEVGEPVFNHEEQTYFIEFRESTLKNFENRLDEVLSK